MISDGSGIDPNQLAGTTLGRRQMKYMRAILQKRCLQCSGCNHIYRGEEIRDRLGIAHICGDSLPNDELKILVVCPKCKHRGSFIESPNPISAWRWIIVQQSVYGDHIPSPGGNTGYTIAVERAAELLDAPGAFNKTLRDHPDKVVTSKRIFPAPSKTTTERNINE